MGKEALSIGANVFQFFTRNPRGSKAKPIDADDAKALRELMAAADIGPVLAHAPYTLNPCAAQASTRNFALETMADDLLRMEYLPGNYYNFHPGSHVGQGPKEGIRQIVAMLDAILTEGHSTTVLLETMAGKGSEVGRSFAELAAIVEGAALGDRLGVCFDTCHVYDAGYDIVNRLDDVLEEFDRILGLRRLKAIHLNDSVNPFASAKDRHAKIGEGAIGWEATVKIIRHPAIRHLPFYLETPNDVPGYAEEIRRLREAYGGGGQDEA